MRRSGLFAAIVGKEIRGHFLSFRFQAVFVLLLVLLPAAVLVLSSDAARRQAEFSERRAAVERYLDSYAHFNRLQGVIAPARPPLPIQALVRGLSDDVQLESFDNDPLPVLFPFLDLTFIVAVLMSLAALILSYDAVCGEREDGTLKLVLANAVPRSTVILAKIAGGVATLLIPFLVSLILSLILLLARPGLGWAGPDWAALGLIAAGAIVYLTLFHGLGLWISARHQAGGASIMTALFVWVLAVLVLPNLSPYAASLLRPAPSAIKVGREVRRLTDVDRDALGNRLAGERRAAVLRESPILAGLEKMSKLEIEAAIGRDAAFAQAYDLWRQAGQAGWDEANRIQSAKAAALEDDLRLKEEAQTRLAVALSTASPMAAFTYYSADASGTGLKGQAHFQELASAWWSLYREYSRRKIEAIRRAEPTRDAWNTPVDVSDMPRFVFKPQTVAERWQAVWVPFLVLAGLALAVFAAAYASFLRADPR
jgi:ABC-type transport system involved in multi-copper enzyme maturation permease subunit